MSQLQNRSPGFSLVELVVAIAVVGILTAIAVPSYSNYQRSVNRGAGKDCMLDVQRREEQFYTRNNTYSTVMTDLGYSPGNYFCHSSSGGTNLYSIGISDPNDSTQSHPTQNYLITAIPQPANQLIDGNLYLMYDSAATSDVQTIKKRGADYGSATLGWD